MPWVLVEAGAGSRAPRIVAEEDRMPGSRSWNRRETNVAQAGFFTVLRSDGWFSALSRLPGGYRYVVKGPATPDVLVKPEGVQASSEEQSRAGGPGTQASLEFGMAKTRDFYLARTILIALAGAAITFGLLWWFWQIAVKGAS
jgi:hypothetical protein